jgi:hypothetical protein
MNNELNPQIGSVDLNENLKKDVSVEKLNTEIGHLKKEVEKLNSELTGSKKDFLTILGIFVSLITFVSIEIQILSAAKDASLLIALSCLMLGGLLLFAMTLVNFVEDNNRWSRIFSPLLLMPILFFVTGCALFYIAS